MKYAIQTVLKSWPWVFGAAILCAGILLAILAGAAAVLLPEATTVSVLSDRFCPAGTDFVVGKYDYDLPTGESGINLTFACVNGAGREQGANTALMVFGLLGALTALFFALFALWLFLSTWRQVVRVTAEQP